MTLKELAKHLEELTIFRDIEKDPVYESFDFALTMILLEDEHAKEAAARFAYNLYQTHTDSWTEYLMGLVLSLENPCSYYASIGKTIPASMETAARHDLQLLSEAAAVSPELFSYCLNAEGEYIPQWQAYPVDLETLYFERLGDIGKHGYGIFASHKMFHMELSDQDARGFVLEPAVYPDPISLPDLIGYSLQRSQIIDNTRVLLSGKKAANILLYGDAGTGKSATVKAVANEFAEEGLRLIELSKNELHLLPKLLDVLGANPLKFILFVDDLSFQDNDDDFSALKAVLEGSISARTQNTVIYATSNRRHIVRETFSQRAGDEVHRNDTMQETISLSERFGIKVYFEKPNKALYLEIVEALAKQYGVELSDDELALQAEQFAIRKSGRSARAARQFIEQLAAKEK